MNRPHDTGSRLPPGRRSSRVAFAGATILLALVLAWWWVARPLAPPPAPPQPAGPPAEVLARLARGVNLSGWLQHGDEAEIRANAPTEADWQLMRALGFQHVRILVDPASFIGDRGLPRAEALPTIRSALEGALRADLLVVVALQLPSPRKRPLAGNEPNRLALGGTWRALAAALRGLPPERLVFEPLNETETDEAAASRALQHQLVTELRAVVPRHTLVVAGHGYAGIDELVALQPLPEPNLVYAFHFYEPHNFTHQGATWGSPAWKILSNFPYPSSPEAVAPFLAGAKGKAQEYLKWHGEERWDRAKVAARLERAAQWARQHGVPAWCSEFGVYRKRTRPADRRAWLRDVRIELEARGIGWSHWDYAGNFGVVSGPPGQRKVDEATAEALGLKR